MRPGLSGLVCLALFGVALQTRAETPVQVVATDRVAVRYMAPELGGMGRPRFLFERMLAFEARLEALEDGTGEDFAERHLQAAMERHIAEDMLAAIALGRGDEPLDLPVLAEELRRAAVDGFGGEGALASAAVHEGIGESEIAELFLRKARAAYAVDRTIAPFLRMNEDELRELFRTQPHPFRSRKFEDVRAAFQRWVRLERLKTSAYSFYQRARSRVRVVVVKKS